MCLNDDLLKSLQQMGEIRWQLHKRNKNDYPHKWSCFEDFVANYGQPYTPQPLPEHIPPGIPKQCFHNSLELAEDEGLIYVEGYAALTSIGFFPIHHAWCVEPGSDLVIDCTSPNFGAYIGIPFTQDALERWADRESTSLIDNWSDRFPLLTMEDEEVRELIYCEESHV